MKRPGYIARWAGALLLLAASHAAPAPTPARGGRVGWARLITDSSSWTVHDANDPQLANFIRTQTSLNIDPTCYPADPTKLEQLCAYPLIFTNNLTNVRDSRRLANLREYLRRGGFIYIDRCVNLAFSMPQEPFYDAHLTFFARFLPGCEIRELKSNHEIFRCYFAATSRVMPNRQAGHNGLYGVFDGGRMVAMLSLANLQCGWPNAADRGQASREMIANIYVYAMTRGTEEAARP